MPHILATFTTGPKGFQLPAIISMHTTDGFLKVPGIQKAARRLSPEATAGNRSDTGCPLAAKRSTWQQIFFPGIETAGKGEVSLFPTQNFLCIASGINSLKTILEASLGKSPSLALSQKRSAKSFADLPD
jgi:hypothetical protein